MFAQTIVDSDAFLDMPATSQLLYFHLSMRADDDGFINKPKGIMRIIGAKDDDLKVLIMKKFIIPFDSGVVVIKHWRIHNYIQKDRYLETKYKDEKSQLELDENNAYRVMDTECIQNVHELSTQVSLEIELDKSIVHNKHMVKWFESFWELYPKKVQKKDTHNKFMKKVTDINTFNSIMKDIESRLDSTEWKKEKGQFIPHPTTYLNQERWNDEFKPIDVENIKPDWWDDGYGQGNTELSEEERLKMIDKIKKGKT